MNVVNAPPSANSQSVTVDEDVPLAITLTGSDPDADPLTYTVTQVPAHGALSGSAPNLVYTPYPNYNGPDSLKFRVNDGHVNSSIATVSITVSPVDDPPVIINVSENTTFVTTVEATDPEHDELSFSITGGLDQALFEVDATSGALSFKSAPDFENPLDSDGDNLYVVVVSVSDGLLSDSQTFHVVVTDEDEVVITQIYLPVIVRKKP